MLTTIAVLALVAALVGRLSSRTLSPAPRRRLEVLVYMVAILIALRSSTGEPALHRIAPVVMALAGGWLWRFPERLRTWSSDIAEPLFMLVAIAVVVAGDQVPWSYPATLVLFGGWIVAGLVAGVRDQPQPRSRWALLTAGLGPVVAVALLVGLGGLPGPAAVPMDAVALLAMGATPAIAAAMFAPPDAGELFERLGWSLFGASTVTLVVALHSGWSTMGDVSLPVVVGAILADVVRPPRGHHAHVEQGRAADESELSALARKTLVVVERLTDPLAAQTQVVKALDDMFPGGKFELLRSPRAPKGLMAGREVEEVLLDAVCRAGSLFRDSSATLPRPVMHAFDRIGGTLLLPVVCDTTVYGALLVHHDRPQADVLTHARRFADLLGYKLETHRLYSELEQKQRLATLGTFSAALVHDLRSPLAAVRLNLQMLEHTASDDADKDAIDDALRGLDRVFADLTETLDFTRPIALDVGEVDLGALARRAVADHRLEARERDVSLTHEVEATSVAVRGDASRLARVMDNLIRNALEVAPAGTAVAVHVRSVDDGVEVSVEDRGPGIDPEIIDRIFEPFVTTKTRGVGLGLAITRKIIERHRGRISARLREGGGTEMRVWLPPGLRRRAGESAPLAG